MARDVLERTGGRLDVLVNNASNFYPTPLGTVTDRAMARSRRQQSEGAFVLVAGAAAGAARGARRHHQHRRRALAAAVARSSGVRRRRRPGLAMLTRSLAKDLGPHIRVNGVSPGAILWPDEGMSDAAARRHHQADRAQAQRRPRGHRSRRAVPRARRPVRNRSDHRRRRRPQRRLVARPLGRAAAPIAPADHSIASRPPTCSIAVADPASRRQRSPPVRP